MTPTRLTNAPIAEALVDFQLATDLASTAALTAFADIMASEFPERRAIFSFEGQLDFSHETPTMSAASSRETGLQLWSPDKLRVIQARQNGFSFSMLRPYTAWGDLEQGARAAWSRFCSVAAPGALTKLSLRYVNQIELPLQDGLRFEEYLRFFPEVPEGLPQAVAGMFMRLQLPLDGEPGTMVFLTEAFGADVAAKEGFLPLVLDIEAVAMGVFAATDELMWRRLQHLRELKNRVFFEALTDRAMGAYL